ncbi:MAG: sulfite exporter TauE/SafE family protein [Armatimonadota bacterium]
MLWDILHHYLLGGGLEMLTLPVLLGLPVLGVAVGFASGLFGVGGGFMLTPLLIALFGIAPSIAVGSGLGQMVFVSITAARKHAAAGYVDHRLAAWMSPGVVAGAFVGKAILDWLNSLGQITVAGHSFPAAVLILNLMFILLLTSTAVRLWLEDPAAREGLGDGPLRWSEGPVPIELPASGIKPFSALTLLIGGGVAGVMAGLLGVGGGIIVVPLLVYGFGISLRQAIGTSSALVLVSSVIGTLLHLFAGHVNLVLVAILLLGSTLGVHAGVRQSHRLPVTRLRQAFALLVLLVAAILVARLLV